MIQTLQPCYDFLHSLCHTPERPNRHILVLHACLVRSGRKYDTIPSPRPPDQRPGHTHGAVGEPARYAPGAGRVIVHRSSRAARSVRSRCRRTAAGCSPSTRPTTGSRSSTSTRTAWRTVPRCRSASSRSRSRRAATTRSGSSTTSPTASASSTLSHGGHAAAVVRTLLVGDEPRDIVFAGPGGSRAFITTAHRGQNIAVRSRSSPRPASGRADVWVFDADQPRRTSLGGHAAHHRHALQRHAARARGEPGRQHGLRRRLPLRQPHHQPSTRRLVPDGVGRARRRPRAEHQLRGHPGARGRAHRQVRRRRTGSTSSAATGTTRSGSPCPTRTSSSSTPWRNPPAPVAGAAGVFTGVGTILFNMVVNPVNGKVYVTNTEARNDVRFEGPGHLRRPHRARPPAREPDHGARRGGRRRPAAPEQAHRLRTLLRPEPERRERQRASRSRSAWRSRRRRDALRRRVRLEQGRRLRHRARSRTTPSSRARRTRSR